MTPDLPLGEPEATTKLGSPWSGLGRCLTEAEWDELKTWRKENPTLKFRARDPNGRGLVFVEYSRRSAGGEAWSSPEEYEQMLAKNRMSRKRWITPEKQREITANASERYRKNPETRRKALERANEWVKENKQRSNATRLRWITKKLKNDPAYKAAFDARRTMRRGRDKQKASPVCSSFLINRIYRHAGSFSKTTGINQEVDHIIPVFHGGFHHELNLQILRRFENRSKGGDPFWMSPDGLSLDWRDVPRFLWPENLRPEYERLIALHPKPVYAIRTKLRCG